MKVLEKAARMGPKYPLCKMQMQTNRSLQFLLYIPVAKKSTFVRGCGGVVDKALMDFRSKRLVVQRPAPHCRSPPRQCINGYWRHTLGGNPAMD